MKSLSRDSSSRTIVAILAIVALAVLFWMLLLSPKREEASKLNSEVEQLTASLAESQAAVAKGEAARREFAADYRQLVVLGKAVPAGDETASLFVQLNGVSAKAGAKFESLKLGTTEGSEETEAGTETAPPAGESGETVVPPTEAAAALPPLGAKVGPAGLSVLPYNLSFKGNFFQVADFLNGLDGMIHTRDSKLAVDGRLVTVNGFSLAPDAEQGLPRLNANFSVTTYLVPPNQGVTAGASPTEPGETEAENVSTTLE
jgi:Tfp pilus assembly protein PilO